MFLTSTPTARPRHRTANAVVISALQATGEHGLTVDLAMLSALGVTGRAVLAASAPAGLEDAATPSTSHLLQMTLATLETQATDAVKAGVLLTALAIDAIREAWRQYAPDEGAPPLVVDPVLFAHNGQPLAERPAIVAYREGLIQDATVVTANMAEAAALAGFPVGDKSTCRDACQAMYDLGVPFPVVKAHFERHSIDYVYDGSGFIEFGADRNPHRVPGSGCAHSSAVTAGIATGLDAVSAIEQAKRLVTAAIEASMLVDEAERRINPLHVLHSKAGIDIHRYDLGQAQA